MCELECPCGFTHWEWDCDSRGTVLLGEPELGYAERTYTCPSCGRAGDGYRLGRQSPPGFSLHPHRLYPMTVEEFTHWADIYLEHFPNDPRRSTLWESWRPDSAEPSPTTSRQHKSWWSRMPAFRRHGRGHDDRELEPGPARFLQRMKVTADYDSWPLWDLDAGRLKREYNLDPSGLSISSALADDLRTWAGRYDTTLERADPAQSGFGTDDELEWFLDDGRELSVRLATELGPAVHIEYWRAPGHPGGIELIMPRESSD